MTTQNRTAVGDIEVQPETPWIRRVPLRSPTLPPAEHTNHYLIGMGDVILVDPGTPDAREQDRLLSVVHALEQQGHRLRAILLTHHHHDHVSGIRGLYERLGVPLCVHAATKRRLEALPASVALSVPARDMHVIVEGEVLPYGPHGLRVLHTPGHAPGHVCLLDEKGRAIIAGDMVASEGTILVDVSDEGDLGQYMASLRRLQELCTRDRLRMWPAHGTSVEDGSALIAYYLQHRLMRQDKVLACLARAGAIGLTIEAMIPTVYDDRPDVHPWLAATALRAHLCHLIADRQVICRQDQTYLLANGA